MGLVKCAVSGLERAGEVSRRSAVGSRRLKKRQEKNSRKLAVSSQKPIKAEIEISSEQDAIRYDKLNLTASFAKITSSGTSKLLIY